MKTWLKITLLVIFIFVAVGSFFYLSFSSFFREAPPISRNSYLELNIYGEVPEREAVEPLSKIFSGPVPTLSSLLQNIRKAKIDDKIVGIILRPLASNIGWGKVEELQEALKDFKSAGKPVYVYLETAGNREYYLAVVGDTLFGPESGNLFINGLMGSGYFFKETLNKIGVEADFIAIGKYKNAPDIFTRESMSDAQREVINAILDDYYGRYVQTISENRKLDADEVRRLIDNGIYSLKDAYQNKLLDTLMYYNEFLEYLKKKDGHRIRTVSQERYLKVPMSKLGIKAKETIALIYGSGTIVSGIGDEETESGMILSSAMASYIKKAADNKNVKAIVMRIDSPGGSGTASDIIWREVVQAEQKKPVIVSMSDVAASGGYYISMAADSIVAQPSSIVGSIGVFAGKFSMNGLYDKLGINKEQIMRGENADIFSEDQLFTDQQRNIMKKTVGEFYTDFVSKAAEGRNMNYQEIDAIAQGRVWTGTQALERGLIDKLGGLDTAIGLAKEMAGIPADEHVKLLVYPKKESLIEKLVRNSLDAKTEMPLKLLPGYLRTYVKGFLHFNDYQVLMLLPFYLEIR